MKGGPMRLPLRIFPGRFVVVGARPVAHPAWPPKEEQYKKCAHSGAPLHQTKTHTRPLTPASTLPSIRNSEISSLSIFD